VSRLIIQTNLLSGFTVRKVVSGFGGYFIKAGTDDLFKHPLTYSLSPIPPVVAGSDPDGQTWINRISAERGGLNSCFSQLLKTDCNFPLYFCCQHHCQAMDGIHG
jgi:hypothetical protein